MELEIVKLFMVELKIVDNYFIYFRIDQMIAPLSKYSSNPFHYFLASFQIIDVG